MINLPQHILFLHPFKKKHCCRPFFVDYLCQSIFLKIFSPMPCSVVCRLCPYISMNWLIRQWYNGRSSSITESILIWIYSNLYRGNFFALFSLSVDRFTHIKCTPAKCRPLIASINLYGCDKCFPPIHVRIYINAYSELREEEEEKKSMASITASWAIFSHDDKQRAEKGLCGSWELIWNVLNAVIWDYWNSSYTLCL